MRPEESVDPLDDLYREVILDHYQNPRNHDPLKSPDARDEGYNPLCGDRVTVEVGFAAGKVMRIAAHGEGCAISQASASIMTEEVQGKTCEEAQRLVGRMRDLMGGRIPSSEDVGELEAFRGVHEFPVRIKCALLPWMTLQSVVKKGG
jgi:nitrogen fixation NifU-like protein